MKQMVELQNKLHAARKNSSVILWFVLCEDVSESTLSDAYKSDEDTSVKENKNIRGR